MISAKADGFQTIVLPEHAYQIILKHFNSKYIFPAKLDHGCNRRCKLDFLDNNFVYSKSTDSVWCLPCTLFVKSSKRDGLKTFVNCGVFKMAQYQRETNSTL